MAHSWLPRPQRRLRHLLAGFVAISLASSAVGASVTPASAAPEATATVIVDFTSPVRTVSALKYGTDITGYGHGSYITNDTKHREYLRRQGFGVMRMDLHYAEPGNPNSAIVCGGDGCATEVSGDAWVSAIRAAGAEPMLILPLDGRHAASIDRTDAVNLYKHFAATGTPIRRFIVGNELDNGDNPKKMDATEYSTRFNLIFDALRALDPAVVIGGPAAAALETYNIAFIETFLRASGSRVDFIDYHDYGAGYTRYTEDQLLGEVVRTYETDIAAMRARIAAIVPGRASQIGIQIGEWNMDYSDPNGNLMLSHLATVWGAAALGTMIHAGAVAMQYGDKNGSLERNTALGLTSEVGEGGIPVSEPLPLYHGIGMITGEGLFRPFGRTIVNASADTAALHVFASTDAKNVVLVNTSTAAVPTKLVFTGLRAGTATAWQTIAANPVPHPAGTLSVASGQATTTLPGRSVTTLVLEPAHGLTATYYDNIDLTGTSVTRVDSTVNFDWGAGTPDAAIGAETFSARWTGQVEVTQANTYTFITTTDDGVRLWVDGTLVIDAWSDHSKRDDTGQITLTAGRHDIKMEYYENGYDAIAQLAYSSSTLARQAIPTTALWSATS
jgi:hypothetical protein